MNDTPGQAKRLTSSGDPSNFCSRFVISSTVADADLKPPWSNRANPSRHFTAFLLSLLVAVDLPC